MGTLIDKLNYLKDTKDLLEEKLDNIGQAPESNIPLRQYLNWTDQIIEDSKKHTPLGQNFYEEGIGIQDGSPTQDNPVPIITNTGPFEIKQNIIQPIINEIIEAYEHNDTKYEIIEMYNEDNGDFYYWINFNNEPYVWKIPEGTSNLNINFYYDFKIPNCDWQEEDFPDYFMNIKAVPFEIYLALKTGEEQKVFTSPNFDEIDPEEERPTYRYGHGYKADFTISRENSPLALVFRNANTGEILESLSFGDMHYDEIVDVIETNNIELASITDEEHESTYSDNLSIDTVDCSINFFNKDNLNYDFSGTTKYHDPSWDWEDSYIYEIDDDDTNTWQLTSLDNGIRIKCNETNTEKDLGIFYIIPNPINDNRNDYKGMDAVFQAKYTVSGDRKPCLWVGYFNLTHDKMCLRCIDDNKYRSDEPTGKIGSGVWAGFPNDEEKDEDYLIIGFGNSAGDNATENDYIDYTNIVLLGCMWDTYPEGEIPYIPYLKSFPTNVLVQQIIKKKILNGTENNWSCTESIFPGVYRFDLVEDENDPWEGEYYHEEYQEEIYDPETGEWTGEYETYEYEDRYPVLCSHFKDMHKNYTGEELNGYCDFYGTGISFYTDQQTTLEEWKNWLQENPVTFYYLINDDDQWKYRYRYYEGDNENYDVFFSAMKNETKSIISNYLNNWKETLSMDIKLTQYKINHDWTKNIIWAKKNMQEELEIIGKWKDYYKYGLNMKDWFSWIKQWSYWAKQKYKLTSIEGDELRQHFNPTQAKPASIQTTTGNYPANYKFYSTYAQDSDFFDSYGVELDNGCWWIPFDNGDSNLFLYNYDSYLKSGFSTIYFTYAFDSTDIAPNYDSPISTEVVPFKAYYVKDDGTEIEVYDSNGASKGDVSFNVPKASSNNEWEWEYYPYIKLIRTDNQEILTAIGIKDLYFGSWYDVKGADPIILPLGNKELNKILIPDLEYDEENGKYCSDSITISSSKNYFNKEEAVAYDPFATDLEYDNVQFYWKPISEPHYWSINENTTGITISCDSTTAPCNIVYRIPYTGNKILTANANVNVEGDRTVSFSFGTYFSGEYYFDSYDEPTTHIDSSNQASDSEGDKVIYLKIEFTPGPNATTEDYAEITNLHIYEGTVDTPIPSYVWYEDEGENIVNYIKRVNSITFDGTENNWSCTESTSTPGLYEMSITEDVSNPWNVACDILEGENWDEDTQDYIPYHYVLSSDIFCTHFKRHRWFTADGFESGDCYFDGSKFIFYTDQQTNLNDWLTWLQANPMTIYYGMNSNGYTTTSIEDTALLTKIEELNENYAKKTLQERFAEFEDSLQY